MMLFRRTVWTWACFFWLPASGQHGIPDTTFSGDGQLVMAVGTASRFTESLVQPDGRLLLAGTTVYGDGQPGGGGASLTVVRLNRDGSPDASFGQQGIVSVPNDGYRLTLNGMALLPDGKILLGGYPSHAMDVQLVRLQANGSLDATFAGGGKYWFGGLGHVLAFAVQGDGKIILASAGTDQNLLLVRILPDGQTLDRTFSGDGFATADFGTPDYPYALTVQRDGKIVVAGGGDSYNGGNRLILARFLPDGSPDAGFGREGKVSTEFSSTAFATTVVEQPDGKLVVSGPLVGAYAEFITARYTSNGSLDPGFSGDGLVITQTGNRDIFYYNTVGIQEDGKIVMAATLGIPENGPSGMALWRYHQDGRPDAAFGMNGVAVIGGEANKIDRAYTLSITGDRIYVGGYRGGVYDGHFLAAAVTTGSYAPLPGHIEAEAFSRMQGVEREPAMDAGGGENLSYIDFGDWIDYGIDVRENGLYNLHFRVATPNSNAQFQVLTGHTVWATVSVPNTGGYQTWQTVSVQALALREGQQTLRLRSTGGGWWNLNWIKGTAAGVPTVYTPIPARIEAESWVSMGGVQLEPTLDAGGGQNVAYIDYGDHINYNIQVPVSGTYLLHFRLAAASSLARFGILTSFGHLDTVDVPHTGGFQEWQTITLPVHLTAGNQQLVLFSIGGGYWNINWLEFAYPAATTIVRPGREGILHLERGTAKSAIFPHPVRDNCTLFINHAAMGRVQVSITAMNGALVKRMLLVKEEAGSRSFRLSLAGLPAGTYTLRAQMKGWSMATVIVKQ